MDTNGHRVVPFSPARTCRFCLPSVPETHAIGVGSGFTTVVLDVSRRIDLLERESRRRSQIDSRKEGDCFCLRYRVGNTMNEDTLLTEMCKSTIIYVRPQLLRWLGAGAAFGRSLRF